jgi:hypothetical protein
MAGVIAIEAREGQLGKTTGGRWSSGLSGNKSCRWRRWKWSMMGRALVGAWGMWRGMHRWKYRKGEGRRIRTMRRHGLRKGRRRLGWRRGLIKRWWWWKRRWRRRWRGRWIERWRRENTPEMLLWWKH